MTISKKRKEQDGTKVRAGVTVPTTTVTEVPVAPELEPPVPASVTDDTEPEPNDGDAAGCYSSNLDAETKTQMIPLDQIELSDDYHFRVQDDENTIEDYTDTLQQYCNDLAAGQSPTYPFPPIVVLRENDVHYIISGRHRFQAATKTGIDEMACIVLTDRIDAIQEGLKSNRRHGLRLNNADKAHCIKLALSELKWSNNRIADLIGCSRQYVDKIAKKERPSSQDTVIGKDGKEYPAGGERNKTKECKTEVELELEPEESETEDVLETEPETVLEIAPGSASSKKASKKNDHIVDELKAALSLSVDTQQRSDAFFGVFKTVTADGFENNQVRRAFLEKVQEECSKYGVHPRSNKGAA
jgi:hypothetical protein